MTERNVKVLITEEDGAEFEYNQEMPYLPELMPFSDGEFSSTDVKSSIIEAKDEAVGKARVAIVLTENGTLGNNDWHGYANTITSNNTPIVIPWDCTLVEYTFSNQNSSIDGNMEFYVNGTSSGDIEYTLNFSNSPSTVIDTPNLSLSQGDLLRLRWDDNGTNPSDLVSVLFFLLD